MTSIQTEEKHPSSPPFPGVKRILVIKFKQIGDALLSIPAIRALQENFPEASISYLLNEITAPMVASHPCVGEVIPLKRKQGWRYEAKLLWSLRKKKFDLVVDLSGGGDRGAIWSFLSGAKIRIGTLPAGFQGLRGKRRLYTHLAPTPHALGHTVLRDLAILRPFGITTPCPQLDFFVPKEDQIAAQTRLSQQNIPPNTPYGIIHPTANWLFKCGDNQELARVIDSMEAKLGIKPVLTCGPLPRELEQFAAIRALCQQPHAAFPGNLTLPQLAAMIQGARVFLGMDSAPTHLAAALSIPTVVLFGPTGAFNWGPWPNHPNGKQPYPLLRGIQQSNHCLILQKEWPCVPCGKSGCDFTRISRCLIEITHEEMLTAMVTLLHTPSPNEPSA